nr:hypothetical protein [Amarillovirales sp.]
MADDSPQSPLVGQQEPPQPTHNVDKFTIPSFHQKYAKIHVRDAMASLAHAAAVVAIAIQMKIAYEPIISGVIAACISQAVSPLHWRTTNRMMILVHIVVATASAMVSKDERIYVVIPTILSTLAYMPKLRTQTLWTLVASVMAPPVFAPFMVGAGFTAAYGFEDEEESINDIVETMIVLEKNMMLEEAIDPQEKAMHIRSFKEIRNCAVSRNKVGVMNALIKSGRVLVGAGLRPIYAQSIEKVYHITKNSEMHTRIQGSLRALSELAVGAAIVGTTIASTIEGIPIVKHSGSSRADAYKASIHKDIEAFEALKEQERRRLRKVHKAAVTHSSLTTQVNGRKKFTLESYKKIVQYHDTVRSKWKTASEKDAQASIVLPSPDQLVLRLYEGAANLAQGLPDTANIGAKDEVDAYKTTEKYRILSAVTDTRLSLESRAALTELLIASEWLADVALFVSTYIISGTGAKSYSYKDDALPKKMQEIGDDLEGNGIETVLKDDYKGLLRGIVASLKGSAQNLYKEPEGLFLAEYHIKSHEKIVDKLRSHAEGSDVVVDKVKLILDKVNELRAIGEVITSLVKTDLATTPIDTHTVISPS